MPKPHDVPTLNESAGCNPIPHEMRGEEVPTADEQHVPSEAKRFYSEEERFARGEE